MPQKHLPNLDERCEQCRGDLPEFIKVWFGKSGRHYCSERCMLDAGDIPE